MYLITKTKVIEAVPERWLAQYPESRSKRKHTGYDFDCQDIYHQLKTTKPLTENDVDRIIGNDTWTSLECDECKRDVEAVMVVGDEPDYESNTASLCLECLEKALNTIKQK